MHKIQTDHSRTHRYGQTDRQTDVYTRLIKNVTIGHRHWLVWILSYSQYELTGYWWILVVVTIGLAFRTVQSHAGLHI